MWLWRTISKPFWTLATEAFYEIVKASIDRPFISCGFISFVSWDSFLFSLNSRILHWSMSISVFCWRASTVYSHSFSNFSSEKNKQRSPFQVHPCGNLNRTTLGGGEELYECPKVFCFAFAFSNRCFEDSFTKNWLYGRLRSLFTVLPEAEANCITGNRLLLYSTGLLN